MPGLMRNLLWANLLVCLNLFAFSQDLHEIKQIYSQLGPANAIEVDGNLDVRLHTGSRATRVEVHGDSRDLARFTAVVQHGVLLIRTDNARHALGMKSRQYKPIQVDVSVRTLHRLLYRGQGELEGENLHAHALNLWLKNSGRTRLEGELGLSQLTVIGPGETQLIGVSGQQVAIKLLKSPKVQLKGKIAIADLELTGNGLFSAYWVDSKLLTVRAHDGARIQLAGVAKRLDLELWGHAQFYGRYLRAHETFVKTHDETLAELSTTDQQHTLAGNNSDVYFYNEPITRNDFMTQSGAVLDMLKWDAAEFIEYTAPHKSKANHHNTTGNNVFSIAALWQWLSDSTMAGRKDGR